MNTNRKLARFGATLALAVTMVTMTAPGAVFATEEEVAYDPSAAPFVLETVNGGIQTAAAATEFGVGIGAAVSGEEGLAIGVGATEAGAAVTGLGLGIPAGVLGSQP
jgi:hypothetical protein